MIDPKTLYDDGDKDSILQYALRLLNTSLRETVSPERIFAELQKPVTGSKGNFGQLVETLHFGIRNNSISEPDFPKVGVELKTTPLKSTGRGLRSKERLVLNIIDFETEDKSTFETSSFWKKNKTLLLMLYLRAAEVQSIDYIFRDIKYWEFPSQDLEIIRRDWGIIKDKINRGLAHEISEGDTMYLGACTKGATAEKSYRSQPNSTLPAKQRAYSLKSRYINLVVNPSLLAETEPVVKTSEILRTTTFEDVVVERFARFYGRSVPEIVEAVDGDDLNPDSKNFYAGLTKLILKVDPGKEIQEFEKANIIVRTSRLLPSTLPKESVSFPYFRFTELVKEDWDESPFKDYLETKFFFVFYQFQGKQLILRRARFWNMPYGDIEEAKKVWVATRNVVNSGRIIKSVSRSGRRFTYFPNKDQNRVSHVRPHGRNRDDVTPLPIRERTTGAMSYSKHCFWLNDEYVRDAIFLKT